MPQIMPRTRVALEDYSISKQKDSATQTTATAETKTEPKTKTELKEPAVSSK
jgi:hypothetical protein